MGFIIGLIAGGILGFLFASMCVASARADGKEK